MDSVRHQVKNSLDLLISERNQKKARRNSLRNNSVTFTLSPHEPPSFMRLLRSNTRLFTKYTEGETNDQKDIIFTYGLEVFKHGTKDCLERDFEEHRKELLRDYIKVRETTRYENVMDNYPIHPMKNYTQIINAVFTIKAAVSELSEIITKNVIFEGFIIAVILANTFTLAVDSIYNIPSSLDTVFLIIYTVECILKIFSAGFVLSQTSYIRDPWNILDFIIVITGWINLIGVKLNVLRALRILRPLRSISSIKGMRVIFMALIKAAKPLVGTLGSLMFFILIFAIAGLQTMNGYFVYQCMNPETGIYFSPYESCGNTKCPEKGLCVESLNNPNLGFTSFDNIFSSIIIVFECVTLQTWAPLMNIAEKTISYSVVLYYIPITFVGAFLILNLSLAVIKSAFTKSMEKINAEKEKLSQNLEEITDYSIISEKNEGNHEKHSDSIAFPEVSENIENFTSKNNLIDFREEIFSDRSYTTVNKIRRSKSQAFKFSVIKKKEKKDGRISVKRTAHGWKTQIIVEKGKKRNSLILNYRKNKIKELSRVSNDEFERNFSRRSNKKDETIEERRSSGLGKTLISKDFSQTPSIMKDFEEMGAIHHLGKLKNSIKIRKDIVKKIKKGVKVGEIKILLAEKFKYLSDSDVDIIPPVQGFEEIFQKVQKDSHFVYKGNTCDSEDELEKKWRLDHENLVEKHSMSNVFEIFNYFSLKYNCNEAFTIVMGNALEKIKCIELEDIIKNKTEGHWSGYEIDKDEARNSHFSRSLSNLKCRIWTPGYLEYFEKVQFIAKKIEKSKNFIIPMLVLVIINAFVLSLDYYGISPTFEEALTNINSAFTFIFAFEILIKILSLGIKTFCRDSMNYIDTIIISLSILEFAFNFGSSAITAFRVIRIFRIFRVARVAKIFRYFTFMKSLVFVISYSLPKFLYLALLLILLNLIYALLGYQIFAGKFGTFQELPQSNFENFGWSYLTVFQVLTLSDYSTVLYNVMASSAGPWSALFIFVWIVIGNFVLLNLFIAILLDSFMIENEENRNSEVLETDNMEITLSMHKTSLRGDEDLNKLNKKREVEKMKVLEAINRNETNLYEMKGEDVQYEDIDCDKSYFLFAKDTLIRKICFGIMNSNYFKKLIFFIIYLNCLAIVWETYILNFPSNDIQVRVLKGFEIAFTVIYLIEFIVKSIALGVLYEKNTYFRNSWNTLDFVILFISLLDIFSSFMHSSLVKIFRVVRAARPLRFISKNNSMKNLVKALGSSFGAISNVIVVLIIVWLMFAILGVSIFSGKLYSCENSAIENQIECHQAGYAWKKYQANFDNIFEAFLSLFVIGLLEDWNEIMYNCIDARDRGIAPQRNYNLSASYYFLFFIMIGSFFFLHLFMGVVFLKFHQARKAELSINTLFLSKEQLFWVEMQSLILKSSPQKDIIREPEGLFRNKIYLLVTSNYFEGFIIICVNLNLVIMAMLYKDASSQYLEILDAANYVFVAIFTLELSFKLAAFGSKQYFRSKWNIFDFSVVITSYIDIIMESKLVLSNHFLRKIPQLFRIFRIFRVSRLLRVFKPLKSVNNLISIVKHALEAVVNVMSLYLLILFIYSIIGVFLFSNIMEGEAIDSFNNFNNFVSAFLLLLRISTGGNWPKFMYDCEIHNGKWVSSIYFTSFMSISILIILNLFIMVIIQNYEDFESNPSSCLHIFIKDERKFKKHWEKYTKFSHGIKINCKNLLNFMYELGPRIGFNEADSFDDVFEILSKMCFEIDEDKNIHYHELLFAVLKRKYGANLLNDDRISNIIMRKEENRTYRKIKNIKNRSETFFFNRNFTEKENFDDEEDEDVDLYSRKKTKALLTDLLMKRECFKGWKNVVKKIKSNEINLSR